MIVMENDPLRSFQLNIVEGELRRILAALVYFNTHTPDRTIEDCIFQIKKQLNGKT